MLQSASFNFSIDNSYFSVKNVETIASKKTASVVISYKCNETKILSSTAAPTLSLNPSGSSSMSLQVSNKTMPVSRTAKLTISHTSGVNWIYYLKGLAN
ncbi:hypothetical protein HMI55_006435 [Coelomomyces lativittatus]|nr:hypothetical protein HMI55_006435 [Coelomomyces lativittatus]